MKRTVSGVFGDDRLDARVGSGVPAAEPFVDDALVGGDDVLGVEDRAVGKAEPLAESHAILEIDHFERLGQVADDLEGAWIDGEERGEHQAAHLESVGIADEARVELLGVAGQDDRHGGFGRGLGLRGARCAQNEDCEKMN